MNYIPKQKVQQKSDSTFLLWLAIGLVFGSAPPIQTTINSALAQQTHSSIFASLISFTVGTTALFILTLIFHRSLKIKHFHTVRSDKACLLYRWHFRNGIRYSKYYFNAFLRCCAYNDCRDVRDKC